MNRLSLTNVLDDNRVLRKGSLQLLQNLLSPAGIEVNGRQPWDIQVHNARFIPRLLGQGNLAFGEAYMAGDWDARQLDELFFRIVRQGVNRRVQPRLRPLSRLRSQWLNLQSASRAWRVGEHHYDIGNAVYEAMLDPRMTYTCGYWRDADNLADAQTAKLDLVCRKLGLEPGMRVLDIGCGWGSFMAYAAEHYGVECVGVTISREQAEWARDQRVAARRTRTST